MYRLVMDELSSADGDGMNVVAWRALLLIELEGLEVHQTASILGISAEQLREIVDRANFVNSDLP